MTDLAEWTVNAVNLAEHAGNPIHTDAGGRAAGFDGALVAGVTTYAYLTHPPAVAWGVDWLSSGGADVRFLTPVLDSDLVRCVPSTSESGLVHARARGLSCAEARFTRTLADPVVEPRPGEPLPTLDVSLTDEWAGYGRRVGDDAPVYDDAIVHPAVWPALANRMVSLNLVDGSWIHTRSSIRHHALAAEGAHATVQATVFERFETRMGERAVLDVQIHVDGRPVATLEHEAIVRVRG